VAGLGDFIIVRLESYIVSLTFSTKFVFCRAYQAILWILCNDMQLIFQPNYLNA
jgi:hypothetical protein